jgi:hypothetical protein
LSAALTWFAKRNDNFVNPIVRGMRKTPAARARVLAGKRWSTASAGKR